MNEFGARGTTIKVTGEIPIEDNEHFNHGDVVSVVARILIHEVTFPEDKYGDVVRIHKGRIEEGCVVASQDADKILDLNRERLTGQGSIIAEIHRNGE